MAGTHSPAGEERAVSGTFLSYLNWGFIYGIVFSVGIWLAIICLGWWMFFG